MSKPKPTLKDCKLCIHSKIIQNELYCRTRLKDENVLSEYGKVKEKDCLFYREIKNK